MCALLVQWALSGRLSSRHIDKKALICYYVVPSVNSCVCTRDRVLAADKNPPPPLLHWQSCEVSRLDSVAARVDDVKLVNFLDRKCLSVRGERHVEEKFQSLHFNSPFWIYSVARALRADWYDSALNGRVIAISNSQQEYSSVRLLITIWPWTVIFKGIVHDQCQRDVIYIKNWCNMYHRYILSIKFIILSWQHMHYCQDLEMRRIVSLLFEGLIRFIMNEINCGRCCAAVWFQGFIKLQIGRVVRKRPRRQLFSMYVDEDKWSSFSQPDSLAFFF